MAITLVIFDVAGTTVRDGSGAIQVAMHDALAAAGLVLRPGAMSGVTGLAKPQAIRVLLEGHGRDELLPQVDRIHRDFIQRLDRAFRAPGAIAPMPGVEELFATLRRSGKKLALNTGFSRVMLDLVLAQVQWTGPDAPIDATIASDEVARGRPWPDMIDALRARMGGIPSSDVAKVGDTPADLQEGTMARCGMVIGVTSGVHKRESLEQQPSDAIVDDVRDVATLI